MLESYMSGSESDNSFALFLSASVSNQRRGMIRGVDDPSVINGASFDLLR